MDRNEMNKRYARIESLNQLRIEREKLAWRIENNEEKLRNDYAEIRRMFSWEFISDTAIEMISPVSSLLSGILSGAQSIFSMFRGRSQRRRKKIC